jgi:predicted RNA-binding protein
MNDRTYWLDLFTWTTWQEFLKAGGEVSGFRDRRWNTVRKIKPGDYLICYLTGIMRFIGVLEVISEPYKDATKIWSDEIFPCRLKVRIIAELSPESAVPVLSLKDQLTIFQHLRNPQAWTGHFRGSPNKFLHTDGEIIVKAILEAKKNPIKRPFDEAKLGYRPKAIRTKIGSVTVPEQEEVIATEKETSLHDEIQWLLLKLGNDMGLDVWVARNDRNKVVRGYRFTDLSRLKEKLPVQFDEATNRTIELIDVLWLKGNAISAAFEIESTTSIYSGLLRMSDLIAMHPNLNIPLYLVVPEERRNKVITEVNRPTFSRLSPPLSQICRLITFLALRERIKQIEQSIALSFVKPEFLEDLSESCEPEEV